jgi:hypothetical protein
MVLEVHSSISSLHPSGIRLAIRNSLLDIVAVSEVKPLASNQDLCNTKSSKGESVAKDIRALSVDLSCDDSCGVSNGLLEANRGSSAILWCHVDIEPTHVESRSIVDSDSTEESTEEFDAMWCWANDQDVPNDSEDVRECY